jgi:hypothetical protein
MGMVKIGEEASAMGAEDALGNQFIKKKQGKRGKRVGYILTEDVDLGIKQNE